MHVCQDSFWVCEDHPAKPWDGPSACGCGGAGMPCPACNQTADERPRLPAGFLADARMRTILEMSSLMETFERRLAPNLLAEPPEEKEIRFNTSENRMHRVWRAYDWANATHKKASQNTPGFVPGSLAGWLITCCNTVRRKACFRCSLNSVIGKPSVVSTPRTWRQGCLGLTEEEVRFVTCKIGVCLVPGSRELISHADPEAGLAHLSLKDRPGGGAGVVARCVCWLGRCDCESQYGSDNRNKLKRGVLTHDYCSFV
jgi:hypothetical protein